MPAIGDAIEGFRVMAILAQARRMEAAGRDIVHMEVGEPDFATPAPIVEAGIRALREGHTHYTPALGLPALREAIAADYQRRFDVVVSPDRIAVTPGASGALQVVLPALLAAGDKVLLTDPGYPCNRHFVTLFGAEPILAALDPATAWVADEHWLERHWQPGIRVVVVASPANPTGAVMSPAQIRALAAAVRQRGAVLVVDEIYQGLEYDAPSHTALAVGDDVVVLNSFSKFYGMTGWRVGWAVLPGHRVDTVDRLAQNLYLAAPTPAQYAALVAFEPETARLLEGRRQRLQRRRDLLWRGLADLGFGLGAPPGGAFYLYAQLPAQADDSETWCARVLDEAGVAITPGTDFGKQAAERHVRFAFTTGSDRLQHALDRLAEWLA